MEMLNLTGQNKHAKPDELSTLSSLIIDGDQVFVDNAAIHGKSRVERGIVFVKNKEEVENGRKVSVVWITLRNTGEAKGYAGLASCEMWIDEDSRQGYKNLAQHVNQMDVAVKGKVSLQTLSDEEKKRLLTFLQTFREELWVHASEDIKQAFGC
jgi:YwhD family